MYDRKILEKAFSTARKNSLIIPETLIVQSSRFGEWTGNKYGDGFIFEEVRDYEPGDRVGDIDKPAYFRDGELLTIRYETTRELKALIVFDMSASMRIRDKLRIATAVFARIFYSLLDSYIPTHIYIKSDEWSFSKIANLGVGEYWYLCKDAFLDLSESGKTSEYNNGLDLKDWAMYLPKKSVIFLISDFLGKQKKEMIGFINYYSRDYYIVPVVMQDNLEYSFLDAGQIPLMGIILDVYDTDTGKSRKVRINKKIARDILKRNEKRFKELEETFETNGLSFAHVYDYNWEEINTRLQEALELVHA